MQGCLGGCFITRAIGNTGSSRKKLLDAAKDGNDRVVADVLANQPQLVSSTTLLQRKTVLHIAAEMGHAGVMAAVLELLMCQASLSQYKAGTHEIAASMASAVINAKDSQGHTALVIACARNHVECARLLLSNGAWREPVDAYGNSAMHYASAKGYLGIMLMLVTEFLDELREEQQRNPIPPQQASTVYTRSRTGGNASTGSRSPGLSPRNYNRSSSPRRLELPIPPAPTSEGGPDVARLTNVQNGAGFVPLHYAVWGKQSGAVQVLLQHGADLLAKNPRPGADASIPCPGGSTPLHLSAMRGHVEISRILLKTYYERVMEPLTLQMQDPESLQRSLQAVDPRTQLNSMGLMPYKAAQRMGYMALSTMLRPQIPLARLFNEEEHRARFYGPPALKLLAAEALNRKLLASLAKVNMLTSSMAAANELTDKPDIGALFASHNQSSLFHEETSVCSAPAVGMHDLPLNESSSPPAGNALPPAHQSAPLPVNRTDGGSSSCCGSMSSSNGGAVQATVSMDDQESYTRCAAAPQVAMTPQASHNGCLPIVAEVEEEGTPPGSARHSDKSKRGSTTPRIQLSRAGSPAFLLDNQHQPPISLHTSPSRKSSGITVSSNPMYEPSENEAVDIASPNHQGLISPFASSSIRDVDTIAPVGHAQGALCDTAEGLCGPSDNADRSKHPDSEQCLRPGGIEGASVSAPGIAISSTVPATEQLSGSCSSLAGWVTHTATNGVPPTPTYPTTPSRFSRSQPGTATTLPTNANPTNRVLNTSSVTLAQTGSHRYPRPPPVQLDRMMSTPATLRQDRATASMSGAANGLPPHVVMLQRGTSITLFGAGQSGPPSTGNAMAPFLALDALANVVEDVPTVLPRAARMVSCLPQLGTPGQPDADDDHHGHSDELPPAALQAVAASTPNVTAGSQCMAQGSQTSPRPSVELGLNRDGSLPRNGSPLPNLNQSSGGVALQAVRAVARTLSGIHRRSQSGQASPTLHQLQPAATEVSAAMEDPTSCNSNVQLVTQSSTQQSHKAMNGAAIKDAPQSLAAATLLGMDVDSDDGNECGVCLENNAMVVVQPCTHAMCGSCAHKMCSLNAQRSPHCPFCRAMIADFVPNMALVARVYPDVCKAISAQQHACCNNTC